MYLPDQVTRSLYEAFDAQYDPSQGAAFVNCDLANQQGSLDFSFSGATISVPYDELVITAGYQRGQPICILGIGPAGDSICVLGDTFLRSAYVVYDLDNNEISLAQTNFNATESRVEEIQEGADGVPDATGVPNAVSTAPVGTGGSRPLGPTIHVTSRSTAGASLPLATPPPRWLGAGVAVAGVGLMMGFDGL
jgi:hypothetical protein